MSYPAKENREAAQQYPVELLQTFLENQSKELELRTQELELAKQQEMHSFEYSKFSTEIQSKDLTDERKHQRELWTIATKFASYGILALTVTICLALYLGREQFVLEIVRVAFYGGCGAVAGSYYQKGKRQESKENIEEDSA
ncbi:MAG: hypothetical protein LBQ90_06400 [Synergistaceae bacterium]|jgi:hypothetical protein|nr:hypothetical protein [Synergistaceae bacterium]